MSKTVHRKEKILRVTVSFEPSRLSDECLATAYELVIPLVCQDTKKQSQKRLQLEKAKDNRPKRMMV